MRLDIFRAYTKQRVSLASPLLLDACRPGELDAAAWRLRPKRLWPRKPLVGVTVRGWSTGKTPFGPVMGEVPRWDGGRGMVPDMLVLRIAHRSAHMALQIGSASLQTFDQGGVLLLPKGMPAADVRAFIGSPLETLVEHPATARGEYVIRSVMPDVSKDRTVVEFAAVPIEWRLPWGRPPPRPIPFDIGKACDATPTQVRARPTDHRFRRACVGSPQPAASAPGGIAPAGAIATSFQLTNSPNPSWLSSRP